MYNFKIKYTLLSLTMVLLGDVAQEANQPHNAPTPESVGRV